jgi:hypothetical protein
LQSTLGNGRVGQLIQAKRLTPDGRIGRVNSAEPSAGTAFVQRDGSKYAPERVRDQWAKDKAEGGKEEAPEEGPSLFPAVEAVSKTISAVKNIAGVVQDLTHSNTAVGRVQLPPMVGGGKQADYKPMYDLERIFTYMLAQEICNQAFQIGMMHGIDFHLIGPDGRPTKTPAPPKAAPAAPNAGPAPAAPAPVAPAPAGGAAGAPAAPGQAPAPAQADSGKGAISATRAGQWDEESVKAVTAHLGTLQDLAASALKNKVRSELESRIKAEELPQAHFFWDADNNSGQREMTDVDQIRGNLSGAWGSLSASVVVEHVENADGGMPDDVAHFGVVADHQKLSPHWVTGGAIDWKTHNDLSINASFTTQPHMSPPEGAYMVHTEWKWDESTSIMDCRVTPFGLSFTGFAEVKLSGDEPDDGWF